MNVSQLGTIDPELGCVAVGTVRVGPSAPMVTFVTTAGTGALRQESGRYVEVDELTLAPGR